MELGHNKSCGICSKHYKKRVNFRKECKSNCLQTPYTYVFWRANYEYDSENWRKFDFHGEIIKKP